ncbi:hypothetical protein BXY85_2082 [Roseivirga pacifica]|jgi:hypothetical protein|uniref:Uncharacterized protein n=1 Tax=Roseivirga pacifica TaxID=1267423 RepID=A0A1I0NBC9_9BACT|nr:hypothetical protein [Roseivirga pacifica]RKQ51060.1 hypothetical protein BXY85_2082 [Roseivirga pacifica]SEV98444.1 hypothetical protein SAMN05216290_1064 [Roseivirga pacifica]
MELKKSTLSLDPTTYKSGWEKSQQEFEAYLQSQYKLKTRQAIQKLKKGETFLDAIEAA